MEKGTANFGSLFYDNPQPSWVYELTTFKILDVNRAALAFYGFTKEEFLCISAIDLIIPDEEPTYASIHHSVEKQSKYVSLGTFKILTKSLDIKQTSIVGYKVNFNAIDCLLVSCQEIALIDTNNSDAVQMLDSSLDVFCTINKVGQFVYVSAAAKKHWGYSPAELIGTFYSDIVLEEDIAKTIEIAASVLKGKNTRSFINRYKKKNKKIAYNIWSVRWDEKTELMYCVARDGKKKIKKEKEKEKSEMRFKALVQEGSDLIGILDEVGNYIYVSPTSSTILGIDPEEFIGRNALEFVHPDDVERTLNCLQKIATENLVTIEPFRFHNKDKEWRWIETVLTNMLDNPAIKGIVANSRDITETLLHRKQIEANELFNNAILESSPDCIKVLDIQGRLQFMNFNGLSSMEINDFAKYKNKNWSAIWGAHNEHLTSDALNIALQGNTAKFIAHSLTAKGTPKWWDVLVSSVGTPEKQIIAVSRDITEQKREEQQLKLLESVITNTNESVLITEAVYDPVTGPKILYVNPAFTKMTGYSAEDVVGKTPRILQGPKTDDVELEKLRKALATWETCEITIINYKKNGQEFWVNCTVIPVANDQGWYTHWIAIERDVTEQKHKELENQLLAQISINFNEENSYQVAASELCKSISGYGNFDWVELWTLNIEKNQVQLLSYHVPLKEDEQFYDGFRASTDFKITESLVGKIWSEKSEFVWNDLENQIDFLRRDAAKKIGLKSVLGIPLFFNDEVLGVLKVGTKQEGNYLNNYIPTFKRLERFIGSELNRKKLEEDQRYLFSSIPHILCVTDLKGKFLQINKAGCDLLGYSELEILYHRFEEFLHPEDKEGSVYLANQIDKGSTSYKFENRYITKTGEIIWLSWYCHTAVEEELIYATAVNISEEKKLRELNRQANSLAKIGSWEIDLIKNTVYWSDEVHELHETDAQSYLPSLEVAIDFYREDFRSLVRLSLDRCVNNCISFDFEAVIVTAKKKELWVRVIGKGEYAGGECKRVYGSFQDINTLREAENRILSLSANLPGVVYQFIIHPDGTETVENVSGGVEQLWGFPPNKKIENLNLVWEHIRKGGDYKEVRSSIQESVATKSRWTCRFKYVLPSGELRTHLGTGTPIFLADGTVLYNSIILDVTQEAKNEALLYQASELARIGSWEMDIINPSNNNMYWSPMVKQILEIDDNYFQTLENALEFCVTESKERIKLAIAKLVHEGVEFDEELLLITATGKEQWIRCIGKSEIANKVRTKIYGSFQDINDIKIAEEKLKKLYDEKNKILESIGDAFFAIDNNWVVTYWNKEAEKILDRKKELVLGKNLWDEFPEAVDTALYNQYHKAIKTREPVYFEIYYKKLQLWLEVAAYPSVEGLSVYIKDSTLRKIADKKLLQANERFEKVTEATMDAIWDWDIINDTYYRSKAVERFFGKKTLKLLNTEIFWTDKFHPDDLETIKKSISCALEDATCMRWELEYKVFNDHGEVIYVLDKGIIIRNKTGKAIRMVGAMTDITEQKQMTLQLTALNQVLQDNMIELERTNEELEQFAFVASHDLQEPLRMISSFMDLLQRKYSDQLDTKGLQYIHFATDGAKRMKQIILDLLDYSKANKSLEGTEDVDMNVVLLEFQQLRRKLISETKTTIESQQLPTMKTYKAAIRQIFHCILDNAMKYTNFDSPPVIKIETQHSAKDWIFSIKDNGIGIDEQFHDKIFVIFQRLHNKDQYNGTGIGLSIAKRHIEFLGGQIWLESAAGEGSVFYFKIPKN